jgi:hypothetical protein
VSGVLPRIHEDQPCRHKSLLANGVTGPGIVRVTFHLISKFQYPVFDWLSKENKAQKLKELHERELKASLSKKLSRYKEAQQTSQHGSVDNDHTELVLNGRKLRVAKKQITITDIDD